MNEVSLDAIVAELVDRYGLPGMAIGVLDGESTTVAAAGSRNVFTGDLATPDTLFQIGSLTKMFTATMVMQLVDAGQVSLD